MSGMWVIIGGGVMSRALRSQAEQAGRRVVAVEAARDIDRPVIPHDEPLTGLFVGAPPGPDRVQVVDCELAAFDRAWREGVEWAWDWLALGLERLRVTGGSAVIELGPGYSSARRNDFAGAAVSSALFGMARLAGLEYGAASGVRVNGVLWDAASEPTDATHVSADDAARVAHWLLGPESAAVNATVVAAERGLSSTALLPGDLPDAPL